MQCTNGPIPYTPRKFVRDFVSVLRRLAEEGQPRPFYPQRLWWCALEIADARDRSRFISDLNAQDDSTYLKRQHVSRQTVATAGGIDGYSDTFTHKTAGGTTQIASEIDTCRAPPTPYDRYRRRYADEKTGLERAPDTVPTTR